MSEILSMAQQFSGLPMGALIGGPLQSAAQANSQMAMTQVEFLMTTCFNEVEKEEDDPNSTTTPKAKIKVKSFQPIMIDMTLSRSVVTPAHTEKEETAPPEVDATTGKVTKEATYKYTYVDTKVDTIETKFALPLLTIVPLNSLAVDSVNVTFDMEVKSSFSKDNKSEQKSNTSEEGKFSGSGGFGPFSVSVSGSISHDSSSSSSESSHYKASNNAKYGVAVHAGQLPLPKGVTTIIDAFSKNVSPIVLPDAPK